MKTDWYRNTQWNEHIELAFNAKLSRARDKGQYLRIQARTLAQSHPEVALSLLDRYSEIPEHFDRAQAFCDQATAWLALGHVKNAMASYEAALDHENTVPNFLTEAAIQLPYVISTRGDTEHFGRALELLELGQQRLTFPVDFFRWHAAWAFIAAAQDPKLAFEHARLALEMASMDHSGFRYHPAIGLVSRDHDEVSRRLKALTK